MSEPESSAPEAQRKPTRRELANQRARALMSEPFLDEALMDGRPPACTRAHFTHPRMRRCPHPLEATTFVGPVNPDDGTRARRDPTPDGGLDGYNWRVRFADDGPDFVLKLFWDTGAPEPPAYYGAQRECQNAALFAMMEAALSKDAAATGPVLVRPRPKSRKAAEANLLAFSDEVRRDGRSGNDADDADDAGDLAPLTDMPRMRRCFGWMQFTGAELLRHLPRKLRPRPVELDYVTRELDAEATYTALVYEFVEAGANDPAVVQDVLDFLCCVGFSFCLVPKAENWESSVLLDYSDIVHCRGQGWSRQRFSDMLAEDILRE